MANTKYELSDIVTQFGKSLIESQNLSAQQNKVLLNIVQCRTSELGGHEESCDNCGIVRYSYNSCGDRHCPKCQSNKQREWIEKMQKQTLPIKHFHVIFTVPHCLNDICIWNDNLYYTLLFHAVSQTLRSFGYSHYGVETGAIAILHTWGQNLSLHPHIHCIIPAAGYSIKGKWKNIGEKNYLYNVLQLSRTFKGKFLDGLKRKLRKIKSLPDFNKQIQKAYNTNWVVYSEAPMSSSKYLIKYLGKYTHRIAITNQRIIDITQTQVSFYAKDYRDNGTVKITKLQGKEFLRRYSQHILPKGFVRIRRYGIYNPTVKNNLDLQFDHNFNEFDELLAQSEDVQNQQSQNKTDASSQYDVHKCPFCKKGKMVVIRTIPRIRSPPGHLPSILFSYFK